MVWTACGRQDICGSIKKGLAIGKEFHVFKKLEGQGGENTVSNDKQSLR